ncbi:hypothetical protein H5410_001964 [Solanum commersonii]|uniref:Uncharacterized protein n=1 Tax=Solanum commersonii TaxID=4109 RepID=A0A9J6B1K1_SOLCO|nr:hypothetical protein H5410_001964 [Solanum commersonii]
MREEMRHFFSQLLQNNPGLNVRDMPGCVGSNIASPMDKLCGSSRQSLPGSDNKSCKNCEKHSFVVLSLPLVLILSSIPDYVIL